MSNLNPMVAVCDKAMIDSGTLVAEQINLYNNAEEMLAAVPEEQWATKYVYNVILNPDIVNAPPLAKQVVNSVNTGPHYTIAQLLAGAEDAGENEDDTQSST